LAVRALGVTRVGATQTKPILDEYRARRAGATPNAAPAARQDGY
jgi:hypothetical protein